MLEMKTWRWRDGERMEERHSSAFSLFPSFPPSLSHPYHFLGTVQDFSKLPSFTHRTTFPLCFTTETWGDTTAPKCGNWTWPSCMPDSKSAHSLSSRLATSLRGHRGQPIPNEFPLLKISENRSFSFSLNTVWIISMISFSPLDF